MGFTLFFQAVLFYIPRYLWKEWEAGKLNMLVQGLNVPIVDAEAKEDRKKIIVNYFTDNRNNHDFYAFRFFFCELLNFINVVGQIYFMDFASFLSTSSMRRSMSSCGSGLSSLQSSLLF